MGSGHTVTALYEVIPVGIKSKFLKDIDPLKYSKVTGAGTSEDLLTVKFRYKEPNGDVSKLLVQSVKSSNTSFEAMSTDFKFASAVALFGQKLRKSKFINNARDKDIIALAESGRGDDTHGYRAEFIRLVKSY